MVVAAILLGVSLMIHTNHPPSKIRGGVPYMLGQMHYSTNEHYETPPNALGSMDGYHAANSYNTGPAIQPTQSQWSGFSSPQTFWQNVSNYWSATWSSITRAYTDVVSLPVPAFSSAPIASKI